VIVILIQSTLEGKNCVSIGPYGDLGSAPEAVHGEVLDAAVLDINLGAHIVFPLADMGSERGAPFLLLSGYGTIPMPQDRRHWRSEPSRSSPRSRRWHWAV